MIHQWLFTETTGTTIRDAVGSAHGQVVVQPGGSGFQRNGRRLRLDGGERGTADYAALPGTVFDGLTDVTIEVWAVPHSFPNWGRVFCIGPGDGAPVDQQLLRIAFSQGGNGELQRYGIYGLPPVDAAQPTPVDREYHYVVTWDADGAEGAGLLSVYRDGELIGTQNTGAVTIGTLASLPNTVFWLGRSHFAADQTAHASYNEVRVHDEVLSPAVIAQHAARGADDTLGLLHRWSFSESTGAVLADSIGTSDGLVVSPDAVPDHTLGGGEITLAGGDRATADFVQFPTRRLDGLTDLTLELWATPLSALNWGRVIDIGDGLTTTPEDSFLLSFTRGFDLNAQRLEFQPAGGTADSQLPTQVGNQYHYVISWDSSAGRVNWYRDGVFAGGFDLGEVPLSAVQDEVIWLGRSHWGGDATANASWNEFRIYNRALPPDEIALHTQQGPDSLVLPPAVAATDSAVVNPGKAVALAVLENDTAWRLSAATLAIAQPPVAGIAVVQGGGRIFYQHTGNQPGNDVFRYQVTDVITGEPVEGEVQITISGDLRLAATTLKLPATAPVTGYQTVDAFPGLTFEDALGVRRSPVSNQQLYVIERRGFVQRIPDVTAATPQKEQFLDIADRVSFDNTNLGEMGLQSIALHPDFATNGRLFAYYTAPRPGGAFFNRLSRFEVMRDGLGNFDPLTAIANPASELILFELYDQEFNHNGGDLHFGPDGYLYVSMGDEGGQRDPHNNSQRITHELYSGILRIDVDKRAGNLEPNPLANPDPGSNIRLDGGVARYSVPADNPFVGITSFNGVPVNPAEVRTEFWAVGFRHPWRMGFDEQTGELWAGDVGQYDREEVNLVAKGVNYGWKYREGTVATPGVGNPPVNWTAFNPVDPVWEYLHNGAPGVNGFSVTGGRVYRGTRLPEAVRGAYIFSDFVTGHIWALTRTSSATNVVRLAGDDGIAAFGIDPANGDLLLCDYVENKIKRLVFTDLPGESFPQLLSETGAFADTAALVPNPGVVAYAPNVPFWSDHAVKSRWFALPDLASTFGFQPQGNWSLPAGAIWVKHFDLELERGNPATRRRIETRFLVNGGASYYGVSYKWNETQTDATLVPSAGDAFPLSILENGSTISQLYEIPGRAACLSCHTEVGGRALSFNTAQLNREGSLGGGGNQILRLSEAGYLAAAVNSVAGLPRHFLADDTSVTLESRVRSYLEVNCVQCHQPGGSGPSTWDARSLLRLDQTGLLNGLPQNNGGDPAHRLVVAGDTAHSVLLQRVQAGGGFTRMPPLGSHVLDQEAVALLTAWIVQELPGRQTFAQWREHHFGSPDHPDGARDLDPDQDGLTNEFEFLTGTSPVDASLPWSLTISADALGSAVGFLRSPNRGYVVERTDNFQSWSAWDVPGNEPWFGRQEEWQELPGPAPRPGESRFFRVRIVEP